MSTTQQTVITVNTPMSPPYWALLERELLAVQTKACHEFFDHYFDERGYYFASPGGRQRWAG
ncbi:MAG: hypothetical protein R3E79_22070 [Caldilineaceae bacterium]